MRASHTKPSSSSSLRDQVIAVIKNTITENLKQSAKNKKGPFITPAVGDAIINAIKQDLKLLENQAELTRFFKEKVILSTSKASGTANKSSPTLKNFPTMPAKGLKRQETQAKQPTPAAMAFEAYNNVISQELERFDADTPETFFTTASINSTINGIADIFLATPYAVLAPVSTGLEIIGTATTASDIKAALLNPEKRIAPDRLGTFTRMREVIIKRFTLTGQEHVDSVNREKRHPKETATNTINSLYAYCAEHYPMLTLTNFEVVTQPLGKDNLSITDRLFKGEALDTVMSDAVVKQYLAYHNAVLIQKYHDYYQSAYIRDLYPTKIKQL